ncbi:ATP-binding protein [Marinimicrobium sp. ABcell2]|uniref:ATP-binding protein n=1 Tax=Marinimicrobium sp. ABcell2 TaxID=3069751 RepID=UPI0027B6DE3A|nr:ATP-binding protein [Marinimicrobium sp. ABcell2]MDQ2076289.1 ATP-binding protein [Marinimicrobium sp. ABcell2]
MAWSLRARLFIASALLLPTFLGLTGIMLDQAFQRSLQASAETRLQGHIYLLFSVAGLDDDAGSLRMPAALMEPDFEPLNSGLYAFVYDVTGTPVWRSNSAQLLTPPPWEALSAQAQPGEFVLTTLTFADEPHWSAHYDVIWEAEDGSEHPFRFAVLRDQSAYAAELAAYRGQLWRWLGAAALLLLIAQSIILRWGLRPLRKLATSLKAMHSGASERIHGRHPQELQRVVDNLNQVLDREQALRQRYRDSLSNLAHSLKTPLAVLRARLEDTSTDPALRASLEEQLERMNQVVSYQLQRAVSGQQQGLNQYTPLAPALQRLLHALDKVYRDKAIEHQCDLEQEVHFPGDEQDLLELLGNLLENAFKYGRTRVRVKAWTAAGELIVHIEDDGSGIELEDRDKVLQRGTRLDSLQAGQGIGLAVSADITASYGGQLRIDRSSLGGACFELRFPLAS